MRLAPQPGPQTMLAAADVDVGIFGGQLGGGKTWILGYEGAKLTTFPKARAVRGVIFRRQQRDLVMGGGLWDQTAKVFPSFGGRPRRSDLDWTFEAESGAFEDVHRIALDHLQGEDTHENHAGAEYDFIGFDELGTFTARQFRFMLTRLRSTSTVEPRVRCTLNPTPDSWLFNERPDGKFGGLLAWWIGEDGYVIGERSGAVRWIGLDDGDELCTYATEEEARASIPLADRPLSITFVLSRGLADNPILKARSPKYGSAQQLATRSDRKRLVGDVDSEGRPRGGCWLSSEDGGSFFDRNDFVIVDECPGKILRWARFWDRAASAPTKKHPDPDETAGVRGALIELSDGSRGLWIDDVITEQEGPVGALRLLVRTAAVDARMGCDLIGLYQDTAGAGKSDAEIAADVLDGYAVEIVPSEAPGDSLEPKPERGASRAKRVHAKRWTQWVEKGRVFLRAGSPWIAKLRTQAHRFPNGGKDDVIDAISGLVRVLDIGHTDLDEAMAAYRARARKR